MKSLWGNIHIDGPWYKDGPTGPTTLTPAALNRAAFASQLDSSLQSRDHPSPGSQAVSRDG